MTHSSDLSRVAEYEVIRELHKLYTENPCLLHGGATTLDENSLHVACKNGSLQFVKEVIRIDPAHVAAMKRREDYEGETIFHTATSQKLIQIQELLLITNNSINGPLVDINSLNDQRGYTALDVHSETYNSDMIVPDIGPTLDAATVEGCLSENHRERTSSSQTREIQSPKIAVKVVNVLLMVLIMAITFFLTASYNPPNPFQTENQNDDTAQPVTIWDMMIGPSQFQAIFYYMISSMAGFFASIGALIYLLRSFPLRMLVNLVLVILIINYVLLVDISTPRFSIIIGSSSISSGTFMGLSAIIFTFCGLVASMLVKLCGCFRQTRQGPCEENQ